MPQLQGKTLVACPKTGEEVSAQSTCPSCSHFRHVSHRSYAVIYVVCGYGEAEGYGKPREDQLWENEA